MKKEKKVTVPICLTKDELKKVNEMSKKDGLSRSTFIGRLIKNNYTIIFEGIITLIIVIIYFLSGYIHEKKRDQSSSFSETMTNKGTSNLINLSDFKDTELTYFRINNLGTYHIVNISDFPEGAIENLKYLGFDNFGKLIETDKTVKL